MMSYYSILFSFVTMIPKVGVGRAQGQIKWMRSRRGTCLFPPSVFLFFKRFEPEDGRSDGSCFEGEANDLGQSIRLKRGLVPLSVG